MLLKDKLNIYIVVLLVPNFSFKFVIHPHVRLFMFFYTVFLQHILKF